jgi:hypothetical protein
VQRNRQRLDRADPQSTRDHRRVAPHNVFVDLATIAQSTKCKALNRMDLHKSAGGADKPPRQRCASGMTCSFVFSGRYRRWNGLKYADGDDGAITKTDNVVM